MHNHTLTGEFMSSSHVVDCICVVDGGLIASLDVILQHGSLCQYHQLGMCNCEQMMCKLSDVMVLDFNTSIMTQSHFRSTVA